ncbi:hypothetical protein CU098_010886 [Rhizopus stolonifer]|uniref:K Homology domain-containing protein n=1 Tax=Rhizopus stolonifer TaxID=4846 RepID=A0A367KKQ7_RHIST|nr:hypothetical protein CU098_010886 [Rhizopus stolonifer]
MHDNGAYIEFPTLGSGDNRVTVYAENRVNAERTLRALNFQACNIYEACFFFNNDDGAIYDPTGSHAFFESTTNLSSLVSQLSQVSGSEVFYKTDPGCIEVLGAERAIRNVYQRLQEMQFLQVFHQYTVFRVESSNEQRDFISGKKNGKINKIMKTSGAKIRFVSFINDYNFIIEVESTSFTKALDGLTLLQEELPAEISFYVPESYHKRIIGVGGKNIQRIMKKYGVYVKFSNTEEFASLGGYYNNEDNVVARTPMKNQINLDNLRHAVMELIHPKDRDYMVESIQIPFHLHRLLIHDYQDTFITEELIKKTNTHVLWPDAELASNTVELLGPEAHMSMAFKMMESIVPEAYDLYVPTSTAFHEAVQSDLFQKKVVSVLDQDYQVSVETSAPTSDRGGFIRLNMTRDKISLVLQDALRVVIDYLNSQKVPLFENTTAEKLFHAVEKKQQLIVKKGNLSASSSSSLLDSTLLKHPPAASSMLNSVSMMRSSTDTVYIAPFSQKQTNTSPSSLTPAQPAQFFNFTNDTPLDNSGWMSSLAPSVQPQPIPSTSLQSNGSGNSAGGDNNNNTNSHLRAIFDAPMELTEQERAVLSNYRYQRMNMPPPPPSNFGFPQAVPSAPTSDIWSAPTAQISGNRRSASTAFSPNTMTSPPRTTYAQSVTNENPNLRRYNEASTGGGNKNVFYPSMHMASNEFNPYNDSPTLKSSQSMPEPMLEAHFSSNRPNFQTSPSFHGSQAQAFGQLHLGNYRPTSSGNFVPQNTPPQHEQQQFFTNTNELNVVQKVFENLSTQSSGSSGYDPRRQNNHDQEKGSRPPPGIDI